MLSLTLLFFFFRAFLRLTLIYLLTYLFFFVFYFLFFCSLSIRRMHLPRVLYYLMCLSLRYVSFLSSFHFFSFVQISSAIHHWLSHLPISVYHPTAEELSASMGTAMEGFFDGVDMVFEAITLAPSTTTQGVPAEASILSTEPVPIGEGTYTKGISKTTLIPTKTLTLQ